MKGPTRDRPEGGFTLTELMVGMLLSTVVLAAAFTMGMNMMSGFGDARRLTLVQRSTRIAMEHLTSAVRSASPGAPNGDIRDHQYCSGFGAYRVLDSTAAPDLVSVIHAHGGIVTQLRAVFRPNDTFLRVVTPVAPMANFRPGDHIVVVDPGSSRGHHYRIEDITPLVGGEEQLELSATPSALAAACGAAAGFPGAGEYPFGALVLRARVARFSVGTFGAGPALMLDADAPGNPEPIAEGVEDMQIAVAVDRDAGGSIGAESGTANADEWFGNVPGDLQPPWVPGGVAATPRALRVTLVARSPEESNRVADQVPPRPENRNDAATPDAFRRRLLSTVVETRNFQGSP